MAQQEIAIMEDPAGQSQPWRAVHGGIEYGGEIISAREWRPEWGERLPDDLFFRAALAEQERALRQQILEESTLQFAGGRVIISEDQVLDVRGFAPNLQFGEWITSLAQLLLHHAYPQPLVSRSRVPAPITETVTAALLDGLFSPRPGADGQTAVEWYGPGLGLSLPGFDGCEVVDAVAQVLRETGGTSAAAPLISRLAYDHGLPPSLSTVGILGLLSRNSPAAELTILPDHDLRNRGGRRFPGDRITWDVLGEVDLAPGFASWFDTLRPAQAPSWRTVVPYALMVTPRGDGGEDPEERAFLSDLSALWREVRSVRQALLTLSRALSQPLLPEVELDLALLEALTAAPDILTFHRTCTETLGSPSRLGAVLDRYRAVRPLADSSGDVASVKRRLETMPLEGAAGEMTTVRTAILAQFDLQALLKSASAWPGLRAQAHQFMGHYASLYRYHHSQYHRQLVALRERLSQAQPRLEALERLNRLKPLGDPVEEGVSARFAGFSGSVRPCSVPAEGLTLEETTVCPECRLTLADSPPGAQTDQLLGDLQRGLEEQTRRLSSLAIGRVLDQGDGRESIDQFLKVVRAADLDALPSALDDRIMAFLDRMLSQQ